MGKVLSTFVRRPLRNWNVENRAQKVMQKNLDKPSIAPKHPTTINKIEEFSREHPEYLEAQKKRDDHLLSNLHGLVVDPQKMGEIVSAKRPLPQSRQQHDNDLEFGFLIPDTIPPGRCSIKQALEFIVAHNMDEKTHTAEKVAADYMLDKEVTTNILTHFHSLLMQIPKQDTPEIGATSSKKLSQQVGKFLDSPLMKESPAKPPSGS